MLLLTEKLKDFENGNLDPPISLESNDPAFGRLLSIFPNVKPARIPIRVGLPARAEGATERTTIMFRGHNTAIFSLNFPLHGGDTVRVRPSVASRDSAAKVIALMPIGPGCAVVVRFLEEVPKWLAKA